MPRERQTRSATLAEKSSAYGFPGVVLDGNDLAAVFRAVSEARARAVRGEGPTLIEAQVYRLGPHSTSDDPHRYRSDAEVAAARERDPIQRLARGLTEAGLLDAAAEKAIWETARAEVVRAFEAAESASPVDPLSLFDDVFETRTPQLEAQRSGFAAGTGSGGSAP